MDGICLVVHYMLCKNMLNKLFVNCTQMAGNDCCSHTLLKLSCSIEHPSACPINLNVKFLHSNTEKADVHPNSHINDPFESGSYPIL